MVECRGDGEEECAAADGERLCVGEDCEGDVEFYRLEEVADERLSAGGLVGALALGGGVDDGGWCGFESEGG